MPGPVVRALLVQAVVTACAIAVICLAHDPAALLGWF